VPPLTTRRRAARPGAAPEVESTRQQQFRRPSSFAFAHVAWSCVKRRAAAGAVEPPPRVFIVVPSCFGLGCGVRGSTSLAGKTPQAMFDVRAGNTLRRPVPHL